MKANNLVLLPYRPMPRLVHLETFSPPRQAPPRRRQANLHPPSAQGSARILSQARKLAMSDALFHQSRKHRPPPPQTIRLVRFAFRIPLSKPPFAFFFFFFFEAQPHRLPLTTHPSMGPPSRAIQLPPFFSLPPPSQSAFCRVTVVLHGEP